MPMKPTMTIGPFGRRSPMAPTVIPASTLPTAMAVSSSA